MLRRLKNAFITGMLILLPLGLTAYILYAGFVFFDSILQTAIRQILYRGFGFEFFETHTAPGIGVLTLIAITIFTGVFTRSNIVRVCCPKKNSGCRVSAPGSICSTISIKCRLRRIDTTILELSHSFRSRPIRKDIN